MNNQCLECAWRFINETGHCYMFKDAPEFRCMKRKTDLAKPVVPLDEDWKFALTDEEAGFAPSEGGVKP